MSMRSQIQKKATSSSYSPPAQKATSWQRPFSDPIHDAQQDGTVQSKIASGAGFNLMQMKLFPDTPTPVQAKLSVGAPGDKYEQEADSMASKVMTMPAPENEEPIQPEALTEEKKEEEVQTKPLAATITPLVQRETAPEESQQEEEVQAKALSGHTIQRETASEEPQQEEEVQAKALSGHTIQRETASEESQQEEEVQAKALSNPTIQRETASEEPQQEEEVQAKAESEAKSSNNSNLESQLNGSKGGGSPLPDEVRAFMEPRFGADFSRVRVHTDGAAVQMNKELGAQAFAHGSDIYYGAGKSPGKDELTAHELTHTVQQTGNVQRKPKKKKTASQGPFVAKLKLHADTETVNRSDLTFKELQNAQVGHSWVSLEYNGKVQIPEEIKEPTKSLLNSGGTAFGFWPLVNRADQFAPEEQQRIDQGQTPGAGASIDPSHTGFSLNPFKWVPGRVEEPDNAHSPKGTKEYELNQGEVNSLLNYVNLKRNADYNLYRFNCTTFAVECVKSAGKDAPSGSSYGIALPNALYSDLYQMSKKGDKSVTVAPLDKGEKHE